MSEKATPRQATEVFAFELAHWLHLNSNGHETVGKSRESFAHHWREDPDFRAQAHARAKSLEAALEEAGLRPHTHSSRLVLKALDAMLTIPARPAYSLSEDPAPFDQADLGSAGSPPSTGALPGFPRP
jgi:hypothetical protein